MLGISSRILSEEEEPLPNPLVSKRREPDFSYLPPKLGFLKNDYFSLKSVPFNLK